MDEILASRSVRTGKTIANRLLHLRRQSGRHLRPWLVHRHTKWLLDGLCAAAALILAFALRFDFSIPAFEIPRMLAVAALLFVVTPIAFSVAGGYRATWQFFGSRDFARLAFRALPLNVALLLSRFFSPAHALTPYSIAIMEFGILMTLCAGLRMLRRMDYEVVGTRRNTQRVLIVATEPCLVGALRQLRPIYRTGLIGIVTDVFSLDGLRIAGVPILGQPADLRRLLSTHSIDILFLCSADLPGIGDVIQIAAEFEVTLKFLPSPHDLIGNRVQVTKNLSVEALRVRHPQMGSELHPAVVECLTGRTVLITGAGGSIGSELARQVSGLALKRLILLDHDENSVFELLNELGRRPDLIPVIADVRDREAIRSLFDREHPQVVLHAAAYKHVPMMESNPCEAVLNNVCGTRELAEAAVDFGTERMVMISSDKAVRPSSVMGATKRLAEVVIQRQANASGVSHKRTHFACVRFGNVLGSRGSVLPIFLKQIARGGPITVTHEEMTRYFMTIPQAVRLVLQAATLASSGDVYMLDMGDPVRIMDFAREVIELSGLTPGKDIRIEVVGSRPGEKLHEQLWSEDADVSSTPFAHVFRVTAPKLDPSFPGLLESLEHAARRRRPENVRLLLHRLPIDFRTERLDTIVPVAVCA